MSFIPKFIYFLVTKTKNKYIYKREAEKLKRENEFLHKLLCIMNKVENQNGGLSQSLSQNSVMMSIRISYPRQSRKPKWRTKPVTISEQRYDEY